jgi:hypothetical protein
MTVSRSQFQIHAYNNPKAKGMHNVFYHEKFRKKKFSIAGSKKISS